MSASHVELLQGMPVFGAISEPSLHLLLDLSRLVEMPAGEFFFREGDPASSMFVLEAGRVALLKHWQGRDHLLHALAEGDCFGEMALMDLCPRSASVRADTDCRALEISAAALLALFERDAEQFALIQMNMGREVCRRLRATDEALFRARMGEPGTTSPLFRAA
jgi:CRP/FNR family transcriptional regulator, cyclic AMP receptor protein